MKRRSLILGLVFFFLHLACANADNTRSFYMGFTPLPYAITLEAVNNTWHTINDDADMVTYHFDRNGIPWTEALYDLDYPASLMSDIRTLQQKTPIHHKRYLAVTPLNFLRTGISPILNAAQKPADEVKFWQQSRLNADWVKWAYYKHCERMIKLLNPDYFAFAIEANILINQSPDKWADFIELVQFTYAALKANHAELPIFITYSAGAFWDGFSKFPGNPYLHAIALQQSLPYSDLMGISAYPFFKYPNPADIPANFLTALADLAPSKPVVIAETGFIAEPINVPSPYIDGNTFWQAQYTIWLFEQATNMRAGFINWFVSRDYDDAWDSTFRYFPDAVILRLWKDAGLLTGTGEPRFSMFIWRWYLNKKVTTSPANTVLTK